MHLAIGTVANLRFMGHFANRSLLPTCLGKLWNAAACRRADLSLNDSQIDMICAAAPYVMAMTRRLRRELEFREEPANIFQFPGDT